MSLFVAMENQTKPKNMILEFLPKAASAMTCKKLPFSSNRDKRSVEKFRFRPGASAGLGFSGPVPDEARRKENHGSLETQKPSSPKVSCMGQIKYRNKMKKANTAVFPIKDLKSTTSPPREAKLRSSVLEKLFTGVKLWRKTDRRDQKPPLPRRAPPSSQMKLFKRGRAGVANFSRTAQIAPENSGQRGYRPDEEMEKSDKEEKEYRVPFSAPLAVGHGAVPLQPRKEVNLWRRRTMNQPIPLKLNNR